VHFLLANSYSLPDGSISGALNLSQQISLGDFMPDLNCPYPRGTEVLARNPDGGTYFSSNRRKNGDFFRSSRGIEPLVNMPWWRYYYLGLNPFPPCTVIIVMLLIVNKKKFSENHGFVQFHFDNFYIVIITIN